MAKRNQPKTVTVTQKPGQLSAPGGALAGSFLLRQAPIWNNPGFLNADVWREFVRKQPIAVLCREAITNYLISLDWAITSRDSEKQDEYKQEILYYTRLLERGHAYYTSMDFTSHIEWIIKDLFDLPFGAASEIGRENNDPEGKVVWIRPLDGGSLAPTLDDSYPVVQHYPNYQPVVFPREFVSRIFLSPRTEIQREGWGMAPPERIYLAMEMLNRGDSYYAQLLLNTPEAGILDLMDMDKESATEWVAAFKDLLYGINPLKVPVLYEHTSEAKWIPFGKLPSEILYNDVTNRYITILTSGYGLSPSDIGFASSSNGGETLAGTVRQERRSARSGKALAKKKVQIYFENILPDYLQFSWIDFDDEKNVAMSRARMANANAAKLWTDIQAFSPDEVRRQAIADGMFTITIPETIDRKSIEWPANTLRYVGNKSQGDGKTGSNAIGDPKPVSSGGQGEVQAQQIISRSRNKIEVSVAKGVYSSNQILGALLKSVRGSNNDFSSWELKFEDSVVGKSQMDLLSETVIDDTYNELAKSIEKEEWLHNVATELSRSIVDGWNERNQSAVLSYMQKKAEEDFIEGKSDSLSPDTVSIEKKSITNELVFETKRLILEKLIPSIILVSEKSIVGYKFELDPTDLTDNNNITVARGVAEKVYNLLPQILNEVGVEIEKILGEE